MKLSQILLATLLLCFAACKEDEETSNTDMIKTSTTIGITTTYTYDSQDRIIKSVSTDGEVDEYTYTSNLVTINADQELSYIHLNSNGLAEMLIEYNDTTFYAYNSDGTMRSEIWQLGTTTYTWSNGNITSTNISGSVFNNTHYAGQQSSIRFANLGMPYLDATSKELVKSSTCSTCPVTLNYTYEFDGLGRVTKRTQTSSYGGEPEITTYTYY